MVLSKEEVRWVEEHGRLNLLRDDRWVTLGTLTKKDVWEGRGRTGLLGLVATEWRGGEGKYQRMCESRRGESRTRRV